jgi:hypothetical protein
MIFLSKLDPLDYVESKWLYARLCYIRWIMVDLSNRPSFLALRPLHVGKLALVIILL